MPMMQHLLFDLGALPYAVLTAQPVWRAHGGELAALCALGPGMRVLDLGCGPGESAFGMLERAAGTEVVGVDLSASMIRFASLRRRLEPTGARATFVQADAMALPFGDATFDAVTGHSFLYLVPDAARVMAEVARVLRPGGRCAFLEPSAEWRGGLLPPSIARQSLRAPRFVASMALWRIVSRGYGRFDRGRFRRLFEGAGLQSLDVRETLEGLGLFGVGHKI